MVVVKGLIIMLDQPVENLLNTIIFKTSEEDKPVVMTRGLVFGLFQIVWRVHFLIGASYIVACFSLTSFQD